MNFNFGDKNNAKIIKVIKYICIIGVILLVAFIFFNYLLFWFLPFIIAWVIAMIIQPLVRFVHKKMKLPDKVATVIILILLFSLAGFLIFLLFDRILYELTELSANINFSTEKASDFISNLFIKAENLFSRIPFLSDNNFIDIFREQATKMAENMIKDLGTFIASKIPAFVTSVVMFLPSFLIFTIILIVSTFYICLDYKSINIFIAAQIPEKVRNAVYEVKNRFLEAIYKYLRAYTIIIFITYFEITVGLLIIGIEYAFVIAALIAIVDILPILGAGGVLIPWGIISIFQKNYFIGFGILILYATVTIIRQFIEPRIVGKSIGLYPVVTLIAIYAGYNALGIFGMFLFPVTILLLKNLNEEGRIHLWKNVEKDKVIKNKK